MLDLNEQLRRDLRGSKLPLIHALARGVKADPYIYVDEWAEKHVRLVSASSAEPGRYRCSRAPYQREPQRALSPQTKTREVILVWAAQTGKSQIGNNWIGAIPAISPAPVLMVQPTVDLGKSYSKQRIEPMIEACPDMLKRFGEKKSRDSSNTLLQKGFPGGELIIRGANAASGLRSMPIRYAFTDEIDTFPVDVQEEGDALALIEARMTTFGETSKFYKTSTPTIEGRSRIESEFNRPDATQEFYHVPCPHCEELQTLHFRLDESDDSGLHFTTDENGAVDDVFYKCAHCGERIDEHEKDWFLSEKNGARWIARNEDADGTVRSFHLNGLYSPLGWLSWKKIATEYVKAKKSPSMLRTFVNTRLAETWKEKGESPEWERLYERREDYKLNTIPSERCLVITCGVDIQQDRIEAVVVGWGRNFESWVLDYRVFTGDTAEDEVWSNLDEMLAERWRHPGRCDMRIARMAIDTGYNANRCYSWIRRRPAGRVLAVAGESESRLKVPVSNPSTVDVNWQGKRYARGMKLWRVGVGILKEELYGWLNAETPIDETGAAVTEGFPPGWVHFPELAPEYFRQLCAEELRARKKKNGQLVYEWHKKRDRNEALDCHVYARAAAFVEGIDRWTNRKWRLVEESLGLVESGAEPSPDPESPPQKPARRRAKKKRRGARGGFAT